MNQNTFREIPLPQGMQVETAQLARQLRVQYSDFFTSASLSREDTAAAAPAMDEALSGDGELTGDGESAGDGGSAGGGEQWLLSAGDFEYFHALVRPEGIGCACPFTWVAEAEKIIDQQYPIFGQERFPNLRDKAAHVLWLLLKTELFGPESMEVGVMAALVLLRRNGSKANPGAEDLRFLAVQADSLIRQYEGKPKEDDNDYVARIGQILRSWE